MHEYHSVDWSVDRKEKNSGISSSNFIKNTGISVRLTLLCDYIFGYYRSYEIL